MADIKPTSIPTKRLSASIDASATTFQLNNIEGWDGNDLTSSDFGTVAYAVFRNDTNTAVEFIAFDPTTIADSSITILYRGLDFSGDNLTTEVSANKLTWVKNETLVELGSNPPQLLAHYVDVISDQTVGGIKTFDADNMPRADAQVTYGASTEEYLATKRYVDSVAVSGAPDASTTAKGNAEEATQAEIEAGTAAGSEARLFVNPNTLKSSDYGDVVYERKGGYAADAESSDTYVITLDPVPVAYAAGMLIQFKPNTENVGACTINVNSLGAKSIKVGGNDPDDGDLDPAHTYILMYDGTNFQVLNPKARTPSGSIQIWPTSTAPNGFLLCDGSAVSRTTYASLFDVLGETYGVGDGSTTFNVPDLVGRTVVGEKTANKVVIEDCEDAWNESVDGDVTSNLDTGDFKTGSGSVEFICAAGLGAGDIIATEVIAPSATAFHGKTHVTMWIKSTVATSAGDLQLLLDDTASCASPLEELDIPALVANTWTRVYLPLANPGSDNTIISIGLKYVTDIGAVTINVDDIAIGEAMEVGQQGGAEDHTIVEGELAAHTHSYNSGYNGMGGALTGATGGESSRTTGSTGNDRAHPNMQPYTTMNYIIKT